jgi:N-acetylmuramoyl-L-alanine amidase
MSKIPRLYINPGHSNTDPGAVGYAVERELNVKVSNFMKEYLLANYVVEIRMNPGTMGNLYSICKDANDWGADLFVSNHFNAAGGDGYEALVYSEQRRALGEIFEKYVEAIGQNSRGVKIRTGLVVLRDTNMPAVLNEGAFVDNKKDIEDWNDDHELKKLGIAYAEAAAEYLKLEKKVAKPVPAPAPTPAPAKPMYRVYGADGEQTGAFQVESYAFNEVKKQLLVGGKATITLSEK